ncbi:hypothetical protein FA13DRAFT_259461 [Coprinellus micaceus]|uniref:RNI-like protein n=1 Tax=Coprinellus micaceus TaxID=71717 RepID=A0A4Y7TEC2_COPMI|nr:hypothetical protein FA13DRAFT_259461 [Coprinellus micaceus]
MSWATPLPPPPREWFPSLEVVRIDSGNLRGATAHLQYLPPSNRVRTFEYRSNPIFSSGEAKDLIKTLGDHFNPLYLQTLRMRDISFEPTNRALEDIDLTPLLAFRRLEKIILAFFGGTKGTPKTLSSIPTAWPKLRHLNLRPTNESPSTPDIDHTHLLELAANLPHLRTLRLTFDATEMSVVPATHSLSCTLLWMARLSAIRRV